jgi:hypothetical protein
MPPIPPKQKKKFGRNANIYSNAEKRANYDMKLPEKQLVFGVPILQIMLFLGLDTSP